GRGHHTRPRAARPLYRDVLRLPARHRRSLASHACWDRGRRGRASAVVLGRGGARVRTAARSAGRTERTVAPRRARRTARAPVVDGGVNRARIDRSARDDRRFLVTDAERFVQRFTLLWAAPEPEA